MINVNIYKKEETIVGFELSGHAQHSKSGTDIVCSAVSALTISAVNGISQLTETEIIFKDENDLMQLKVDEPTKESKLLLSSMHLALIEIEEQFPKNVYISEVIL